MRRRGAQASVEAPEVVVRHGAQHHARPEESQREGSRSESGPGTGAHNASWLSDCSAVMQPLPAAIRRQLPMMLRN